MLVLVIGLTGNPIAVGIIITVIVYIGIHISGAHYNPAVSIAMLIRGTVTLKETIYYIFSQLLGAVVAAFIVFWKHEVSMIIKPCETASVFQILFIEFIFTVLLIFVILFVAADKRTAGNSYYGLVIGFTVMFISYFGAAISGGAYNPAVGTGPILVDVIMGDGNTLSNLWYYLVGPIIGAVAAAYVYKLTAE
jgi:aquaporin Z